MVGGPSIWLQSPSLFTLVRHAFKVGCLRQAPTADSENDKSQNLSVSNSGRFPLLEPHDRASIDDNNFSKAITSVFERDTKHRVYLTEEKQASCATSAANHLPARVKKSRLE